MILIQKYSLLICCYGFQPNKNWKNKDKNVNFGNELMPTACRPLCCSGMFSVPHFIRTPILFGSLCS
jgi:hypothetical protein